MSPLTLTHAALTGTPGANAGHAPFAEVADRLGALCEGYDRGVVVSHATLDLILRALGGDLDEPEFRALHTDLRNLAIGEEG